MTGALDSAMRREILRQPQFIRALGDTRPWETLAGRFPGLRPVLTGCGTSYFAARLAAAWVAEAGSVVPAVQAFELLRAPKLTTHGNLLVALSHSGDTPAVIDLFERARRESVPTILVTGVDDSPAARLADAVVPTGYAEQLSLCHTISFTLASLTALGVLHRLDQTLPAPPEFEPLAVGIESVLAREEAIREIAPTVSHASSVWLLGAGPTEPLAAEFGLKLCEAAYVPAQPLELEQFFHGYIPAMERDATVIAALPDETLTRRVDLRKATEVIGVKLAEVSHFTLGLPTSAQPWAMAVVLQLLTVHVAAARGTDPDQLRREDPIYLAARRAYR